MIAAGHWRAETEQEKKNSWEESVRLRERMFWARLGGGVVPAYVPVKESPRSPTFPNRKGDVERKSEESQMSEQQLLDSAVDVTMRGRRSHDDPFQVRDGDRPKRVSIGKTVIADDSKPAERLTQEEERKIEKEAEAQLQTEVRKSIEAKRPEVLHRQRSISTPISPLTAPKKKDERLSLTIPGSFK
jgi:hypothetical protein